MFATKGFMLAMHVPSFLAKDKSKLTRSLYRIGKSSVDVKQEWKFLNDLKNVITASRQLEGFTDTAGSAKTEKQKQAPTEVSTISNKAIDNERQDPLRVLKLRLAKGEIDKKEYQELYNAISS